MRICTGVLVMGVVIASTTGCSTTGPGQYQHQASPAAREKGLVPEHMVPARYPAGISDEGQEGCVSVAFDVRPDGHTEHFQLLDAKPDRTFVHSTMRAIREWRYPEREEPARLVQIMRFDPDPETDGPGDTGVCISADQVPDEYLVPGPPPPETGKPTPLKFVQPQYPRRAALRRAEGCVTLAFDVLPDGTTANIQVLDSQPPGVFTEAVTEAVEQWRYLARKTVLRRAQVLSFSLASSPEGAEDSSRFLCVQPENVPESYLEPGPDQPEPPDDW